MISKRKQHAPEFMALEALTGEAVVSELARVGVHPTMINQWRWEDHKTIQ